MAHTAGHPASGIPVHKLYLTAYNILFASLWASVFINATSNAHHGKFNLFAATEAQARWIQTASLIEVVHAATGLVKSPVSTTALQVVTRVIQVWMVWFRFPQSTASSHAYLALLLAWSTADTIRYTYLALKMWNTAPQRLLWLRYTMFFPLYPIGIGAESWLLFRAIEPSRKTSAALPPVFWLCLMLYAPGSWKMYTHMITQRYKTLSAPQKTMRAFKMGGYR
ncbi:tyrosine phosphatase-like protein [Ampelomyces quisqualis]|uniref:Very-long-chain (3R)-3-hydroxyacyl-CoA dehydratase n=1 Tax=Ampelomyces quisqualis TaxID=50730 RepID=A0A6A5QP95_AMPQU|nr:tyrosine phosphatase-like protein [Ampelomyces quisqualis]